jgi:hypothetical protein
MIVQAGNTDERLSNIEYFAKLKAELSSHFSAVRKQNISSRDIHDALFVLYADKFDLEFSGWLTDSKIEFEDALKALSDFDFNELFCVVEIDSEVFPMGTFIEKKVQFKAMGQKWIIHKNDKDPFPSNPHAHHYEQNLKLDLGDGTLYNKRTKVKKIRYKDLLDIRARVKQVFSGELPPLQKI